MYCCIFCYLHVPYIHPSAQIREAVLDAKREMQNGGDRAVQGRTAAGGGGSDDGISLSSVISLVRCQMSSWSVLESEPNLYTVNIFLVKYILHRSLYLQ